MTMEESEFKLTFESGHSCIVVLVSAGTVDLQKIKAYPSGSEILSLDSPIVYVNATGTVVITR